MLDGTLCIARRDERTSPTDGPVKRNFLKQLKKQWHQNKGEVVEKRGEMNKNYRKRAKIAEKNLKRKGGKMKNRAQKMK